MTDLGLGFRGNKDWNDLSDFVVHLTRPGTDLLSILGAQTLKPGPEPFGSARHVPQVKESQRAVCFSEIPLGKLSRLVQRRSCDGLGFTKAFILERGAAPVWYLEKGSPAQRAIEEQVREATRAGVVPEDPLWRLTPFIDQPGPYRDTMYRFEWEREWRHVGALKFDVTDVAFLLLEEHLHATAREFFEYHQREQSGPSYLCAYIDPRWDETRVEAAFGDWHQKYKLMDTGGVRWIQERWE